MYDGYEPNDPKHPDYTGRLFDRADALRKQDRAEWVADAVKRAKEARERAEAQVLDDMP